MLSKRAWPASPTSLSLVSVVMGSHWESPALAWLPDLREVRAAGRA